MTMTPAQFRQRLEALGSNHLESYSDVVAEFGAPLLMAHCDAFADYTERFANDLDDQCYRAVHGIIHGQSLAAVQAFIDPEYLGGAGGGTASQPVRAVESV